MTKYKIKYKIIRYLCISLVALSLFSAIITNVESRSGGPDYYGYIFKDSNEPGGPTYSYVDISAGRMKGTKILENINDGTESIPIGFTFNFYGTNYNNVIVSTNGLMGFGGIGGPVNQPIDSSSVNNLIASFWDDLTTENKCQAGEIYYKTLGNAPDRNIVVQWHDIKAINGKTCTSENAEFEVIIYENGEIKFQYQNTNFGNTNFNNGASATVGIRGLTGGLQYSYNNPSLSNELAILFSRVLVDTTPPGSITGLTNITYAQTYINWTWIDPTDIDFSKVMVYIDGVFQTNVSADTRFYNTTANFVSLSPDTDYEISTRTVDTNGNINQTWVNATNRTAPMPTSLSISINNGDEYTNSTSVQLSLSAVNAQEMSFSNDDLSWSSWEPFATTKSWTLTNEDGLKTVYFKARYGTGESLQVSDTIILDTIPPSTTINIQGDLTLSGWYSSSVEINLTATDGTSGIKEIIYNINDAGPNIYSGNFTIDSQGHTQIQYNSIDNADNKETVNTFDIYIDSIAPQIDISGVSNGEVYNTNVTPIITITDDNIVSSSITLNDEPFTSGTEITQNGNYWLNVTATDIAGHVSTENISFTIDKMAPVLCGTSVVRTPEGILEIIEYPPCAFDIIYNVIP